ncbi:MAG: metal ABC transporter substrate-binding protein, partial [Dehalococcoidales bacterium]|nr:metal ABC transporter substrate-binding protein [Dehalococcoidales bacterium]
EMCGVVTIILPAACPGHFDTKPGDVKVLANARLFLKHGWEGFADNLVKSANNPALSVVQVQVEGNWMVPETQAKAIDPVVDALSKADPAGRDFYQQRGSAYKDKVLATGRRLRDTLAGRAAGVRVLCSQMQVDFVKWAGFEVVDTFGRPEETTPQKLQELVAKGRASRAALVINNLQSDPDAGKGLAQEIGAVQLNLSNFPGAFEGTETWEKAVERNVDLLLEALDQRH